MVCDSSLGANRRSFSTSARLVVLAKLSLRRCD